MIPTSPTSPVSWTAAAAPAVAPVPAVMAVAPAAAAARDAQGGLEQRRGQARQGAGNPPGKDPAGPVATELARAERAREQAERLREIEQARRETVEDLRRALRKAWDASAAVVEQALAREGESRSAVQTARALDAYGAPGDAADKPPGISRRV